MLIFSRPSRSSSSKPNRGFTLIELLTVVAIIGILASIVLTSLNSTRIKSRDNRRLQDLDAFQAAVEQYFRDNGHYPLLGCSNGDGASYAAFPGSTAGFVSNTVCSTAGGAGVSLATALSPYLTAPLLDPNGPVGSGGYLYKPEDAVGSNYCILINRTPENMCDFPIKMIDMSAARCGGSLTNCQCTSGSNNNNIYYSSSGASGC